MVATPTGSTADTFCFPRRALIDKLWSSPGSGDCKVMVENIAPLYYVWGIDNIAYGPVELPALVSWVKQERVLNDTWVFSGASNTWTKATELPELKPLFGKKEPGTSTATKTSSISPS